MAYERLYQTSFETNDSREWGAEITIFALTDVLTNHQNLVHTGSYALDASESRAYFGNFQDIDQISANYFAKFTVMRDGTTMGKLYGMKAGVMRSVGVFYTGDTSEFYIEDSASVEYGIRKPSFLTSFTASSWMAIGITAKAGVDGWISLYIDGELVIKATGYFFDDDGIQSFGCGGSFGLVPSTEYVIDDISIDSCTEDEVDAPPHSPSFYAIRPNSRGLSDEWIPVGSNDNYLCVSTYSNNTDDIPYVFAEYNDLKDTYRFPAPLISRVKAMIPTALVHGGGSLFGTEIKFVTSNGIDELVGATQEVGYALDVLWERFETAPDSSTWTPGIAGETDFGFISVIAIQIDLVATVISDTEIHLTWNDIYTDEDGWSLERSLVGVGDWFEIADLPANTISYDDTGLDPDTQYFYRIRAYRNP